MLNNKLAVSLVDFDAFVCTMTLPYRLLFLCVCLLRWLEKVNLKVRATCAHPPELKGQRVKDIHIFKSCPGERPSSTQAPRTSKPPKATKPKPALLNGPKVVRVMKARARPGKRHTQPQTPQLAKQATVKKRKVV